VTRGDYLAWGAMQTCKRGNDLPQAKLDADKVRAIRQNRHGKTAKCLAAEYGVHIRTIDKIRDHVTWRHV